MRLSKFIEKMVYPSATFCQIEECGANRGDPSDHYGEYIYCGKVSDIPVVFGYRKIERFAVLSSREMNLEGLRIWIN